MATKSKLLVVKIEPAQYETLCKLAAADDRTLSAIVRRFLKQQLEAATAGMNVPPELTA